MSKVVGSYETENEAIRAIEDLQQQGHNNKDISVLSKDKQETETITEETETHAGEGAATGAGVGGLIGLGVPDDEAEMYETHNEGKILVLVEEDKNTIPDRSDQDTFTTERDPLIGNERDTTIRGDQSHSGKDPLNGSRRGQAGL
ncbi:general stress protein [Planococcus antarcticus DSM 14505]|uniref:General stress protein n=1 Tax=Planococcus antarcticus DSM 14505 TaxID=1185653 RepID=A0ABN4RHC6_9BACL|nr:general stress protein [Planococcus antarcticus]ANU11429.1 general stress protein [Planococcus antarcticus DSM 14505]